MLRIILAASHLLALAIGLGGVWARARGLGRVRPGAGAEALGPVFAADAFWGIAALLWLGTGLARWLMGTEKNSGYYPSNHFFLAKMGLFVVILLLELRPMITLARWRRQAAAGKAPDTAAAGALGTISYLEAAIVIVMVFFASLMARGYGVAA